MMATSQIYKLFQKLFIFHKPLLKKYCMFRNISKKRRRLVYTSLVKVRLVWNKQAKESLPPKQLCQLTTFLEVKISVAFLILHCRNPSSVMSVFRPNDPSFSTKALHEGQEPEQWNSMAVVPHISMSTTFKQQGPADFKK